MLLYHLLGEHDGDSARGRSTRAATAGSPRCCRGPRSRSGRRSGSRRRSSSVRHRRRPGPRRRARGRDGVRRAGRRLGARPAPDVPRARRPAGAAVRPRRRDQAVPVPGHVAPRSTSRSTGCRCTRRSRVATDHFRGFTNIGPSMEYLERAFDEAKYGWYSSRPYLDCADPEHDRPRHGAARQARDVVVRAVRAVPPPRERLGHGEGEPGRHRPARRWSRSSRGSGT